jgi:hypothetical protein
MEMGTWAIRVIPPLLYTWQFYDVVEPISCPNRSKSLYFVRQGVTVVILALTVVTFILDNLWNAKMIFYLHPSHLNSPLSEHFADLAANLRHYTAISQVSCCVLSSIYIMGTVFLVDRLSKTEQFQGMKLDKFVAAAHALTIFLQSILMSFLYYIERRTFGTQDIFLAIEVMISSGLDTVLCCMICLMVHDNWEYLEYEKDKSHGLFKDSLSEDSHDSLQQEEPSSESEGEEFLYASFHNKTQHDVEELRA